MTLTKNNLFNLCCVRIKPKIGKRSAHKRDRHMSPPGGAEGGERKRAKGTNNPRSDHRGSPLGGGAGGRGIAAAWLGGMGIMAVLAPTPHPDKPCSRNKTYLIEHYVLT